MSGKRTVIMVRGIIVLALMGSIFTVQAQVEQELKKFLTRKDFKTFREYTNRFHLAEYRERYKDAGAHWEYLREIVPGYSEGIFYCEQYTADKENSAIQEVRTYRIRLIATETRIIYYRFEKTDGPAYEVIDSFKDKATFKKLEQSFKSIFGVPLNKNELFMEGIVYGSHCGFAAIDPEEKTTIDRWAKEKNKAALMTWLCSTNTEKQVYAVDGFYQLKQAGVLLTKREMTMIIFIMHKKGDMQACSGCIYSSWEIASMVEQFKF